MGLHTVCLWVHPQNTPGVNASEANVSGTFAWLEEKGDHFIVYYTEGKHPFARDVLWKSEKDYQRIAELLGYGRHSNFWTWDKRVKIYLYPDRASYRRATQMPEWSQGMAEYTRKEIASYLNSELFLQSILPHEIAHLIFRDFVGFQGEVPVWLDEGVAQWSEAIDHEQLKALLKEHARQEKLFSLEDMMRIDIREVTASDTIAVRRAAGGSDSAGTFVLSGDVLVGIFYLQAATLVGTLIEDYGLERFSRFCRELRDGAKLDAALKAAYPQQIETVGQLERAWLVNGGVEATNQQ